MVQILCILIESYIAHTSALSIQHVLKVNIDVNITDNTS